MNLYVYISMKRLGVHISRKHDKKGDFSVRELIEDETRLGNLLNTQKIHSPGKPNLTIIGTLFGKRYSVFPIAFFDMTALTGKVINATPENVYIKVTETGGLNYYIHPRDIVSSRKLSNEEEKQLLYSLVAVHLTPLFEQVSSIANCKVAHLQSLVSHNLHQRSIFLQNKFSNNSNQIDDLLHRMTQPDLFASKKNPLNFTFRKVEKENGTVKYIRKYCCLAYLQYEGDKSHCCGTCPHINKN